MTTQGDVTNPLPFIGVTPCRIVDTRGAVGPFGGPALVGGVGRNFDLPSGPCAGIPAGAAAYSLNFTVVNAAGNGFIEAWPEGGAFPTVSTLNYIGGQTIANAAIVPAGTAGGISVVAGVHGTNLLIDINGYFSSTLGNTSNYFTLQNNSGQLTMRLENDSGTCSGACGLLVTTQSGTATRSASATGGDGVYGTSNYSSGSGVHGFLSVGGSSAVRGEHTAKGFLGIGVYGSHAGTGWGVWGQSLGTSGAGAIGVLGEANSTDDGTVGVQGNAVGASGVTFGVYGKSLSTSGDSAGVLGTESGGRIPITFAFNPAGVLGESTLNNGVLGMSQGTSLGGNGVLGFRVKSGDVIAYGALGTNVGPNSYGVYSGGDFGGIGAKYFVEPHPTDASKVIRYVCLEGPESGTYFRGSAQIIDGSAVISVPEDFRIVTDSEGLTVQLTPVGAPASMYIVSEDLNQIVVKSNRDVRFHYMVNGVRKAFKDHQAIDNGNEFMPRSASETIPAYLTAEAKRRLIANGTYNEDGTVNLTTAERVGWTKTWAEQEQATKEAAAKASLQRPGAQQIPQRQQ
jgi:hypothetical protein